MNKDLLNTQGVADLMGVTRQMVLKMIKSGKLPAEKFGREWMLQRRDVECLPARQRGRPALRPMVCTCGRSADPHAWSCRVRKAAATRAYRAKVK